MIVVDSLSAIGVPVPTLDFDPPRGRSLYLIKIDGGIQEVVSHRFFVIHNVNMFEIDISIKNKQLLYRARAFLCIAWNI
jgi:hypothetical protein